MYVRSEKKESGRISAVAMFGCVAAALSGPDYFFSERTYIHTLNKVQLGLHVIPSINRIRRAIKVNELHISLGKST